MYRNLFFFQKICFGGFVICLFLTPLSSQAKPQRVSSPCQNTSLPKMCQALQTLYHSNGISFPIQNREVCSWDEVSCNNQKQVIELHFNGKSIKVLPSNIFSSLSQLQVLDLGNNQLKSLPDDIFAKLSQL